MASAVAGWRGFGGYEVTTDTVKFDEQLDNIALWLDGWDSGVVSILYLSISDERH